MHRRIQRHTHPSSAGSLRCVAGMALALAFLLAQIAGQVHRAEAAHRLCVEHGELEHDHTADRHAALEREEVHAAVRAAPADAAVPPSAAHEACELAQLLHLPQAGAPAQALAPCAAPPAASVAVPDCEARPREVRARAESARGPPRAA